MRLIRWTPQASDQLEAAVKHIRQDNPTAATDVAQAVINRIERLATFLGLGRPGELNGTRELVSMAPRIALIRHRYCRPHQKIAIGFNGDPVPLVTAIGEAVNKNTHRFLFAAASPNSSRSQLSKIAVPIATSSN